MDKPIYISYLDSVPTLSIETHEVCDPDPVSSEEMIHMWDVIKHDYLYTVQKLEDANKRIKVLEDLVDKLLWINGVKIYRN